MLNQIINWLEAHQQTCHYREILGFKCPGCGFQRSLIALLKGNVGESILLYPGLIPMLLLFVFLLLHVMFHFKHGARILKYLFIADITIIMINYIVQFIH